MYARTITFNGAKNIDDGVTLVREKAVPVASGLQGYRGITVSADRRGGVLGILSLWETEADRTASQKALDEVRQEAVGVVGGEMTIENFEQVVAELAEAPPGPGAVLLLQRVSMDPAKVEDNLAFFRSEIVPLIKAGPGFRGVRNLINRETGQGMVGTTWDDADARRSARAQAQERRPRAMERGVNFGETSEREILFADLR